MRQFPEGKPSGDRRFRPVQRWIQCGERRILEVKDTPTRRVQSTAGRVEDQRAHDSGLVEDCSSDRESIPVQIRIIKLHRY